MLGALVGPDPQIGVSGFGVTIRDALRDLATHFDAHSYRLGENAVTVETLRKKESARGNSRAMQSASCRGYWTKGNTQNTTFLNSTGSGLPQNLRSLSP